MATAQRRLLEPCVKVGEWGERESDARKRATGEREGEMDAPRTLEDMIHCLSPL